MPFGFFRFCSAPALNVDGAGQAIPDGGFEIQAIPTRSGPSAPWSRTTPGANSAPSDSTGAVGNGRYIELVNTNFGIYNKTPAGIGPDVLHPPRRRRVGPGEGRPKCHRARDDHAKNDLFGFHDAVPR